MGDHLIVETPDPADEGACGQHKQAIFFSSVFTESSVLGRFPSHTSANARWMFQLNSSPLAILKPFLGDHLAATNVAVHSNWQTRKAVFHNKDEIRDWIPGINLFTFLQMGGVLPQRARIAQWLREFPLPAERHGDMKAWNFILDARGVHLIDGHDDKANFDDREALDETIRLVEA